MNTLSIRKLPIACLLAIVTLTSVALGQESDFKKIEFKSIDGLEITADLYMKFEDKTKPFIVLCHQAGWSRGEYREIAPKLNALGFNCLAIDQRSGKRVNGVNNETASRAVAENKRHSFADAEQDILAAVKYVKANLADGKLLLWGSSYSSSLVLHVTGEHPDLVNGTLAFSPSEYFSKLGKPEAWIATSVATANCPIFITSAKNEARSWRSIYDAIKADGKIGFLPKSAGHHGSRALYSKYRDSPEYWNAVKGFLKQFE